MGSRKQIIVVSGSSGVGKSTVCQALAERHPEIEIYNEEAQK